MFHLLALVTAQQWRWGKYTRTSSLQRRESYGTRSEAPFVGNLAHANLKKITWIGAKIATKSVHDWQCRSSQNLITSRGRCCCRTFGWALFLDCIGEYRFDDFVKTHFSALPSLSAGPNINMSKRAFWKSLSWLGLIVTSTGGLILLRPYFKFTCGCFDRFRSLGELRQVPTVLAMWGTEQDLSKSGIENHDPPYGLARVCHQ